MLIVFDEAVNVVVTGERNSVRCSQAAGLRPMGRAGRQAFEAWPAVQARVACA